MKTTVATERLLYGNLWRKVLLERSRSSERTWMREAAESPLLEAVTRERLVKTAGWKRLSECCGDLWIVEISDGAVIGCGSESYAKVVNKSNIQSITPSRGNTIKLLWLFRSMTFPLFIIHSLLILYFILVRFKPEYVYVAWKPVTVTESNKFESIKTKFPSLYQNKVFF
jgi:hypothetical protein